MLKHFTCSCNLRLPHYVAENLMEKKQGFKVRSPMFAQDNDSVQDHDAENAEQALVCKAQDAHKYQTCSRLFAYTGQSSDTLRTIRVVGREGEAMCRTSACTSLPVSFGMITPGTAHQRGTLPG